MGHVPPSSPVPRIKLRPTEAFPMGYNGPPPKMVWKRNADCSECNGTGWQKRNVFGFVIPYHCNCGSWVPFEKPPPPAPPPPKKSLPEQLAEVQAIVAQSSAVTSENIKKALALNKKLEQDMADQAPVILAGNFPGGPWPIKQPQAEPEIEHGTRRIEFEE